LYDDGLEHLRTELEKKYNIDSIDQISSTLAADVNCTERNPQAEGPLRRISPMAIVPPSTSTRSSVWGICQHIPRSRSRLPRIPCIVLVCTFQLRGSNVIYISRQTLLRQEPVKSK
jgi:hypothetical protein